MWVGEGRLVVGPPFLLGRLTSSTPGASGQWDHTRRGNDSHPPPRGIARLQSAQLPAKPIDGHGSSHSVPPRPIGTLSQYPGLYHACTTHVPPMYHACTMHVPRMYLAFTSQSPPKHMACTWLSPRMNLACRQLGRPVTNQASHITPAFGRLAAFILHPSSLTSGWLWGILGVALGSHWGRIGVALGCLWGAYRLAINRLWGGFDVALMWLWGGLGRRLNRGLPGALHSALYLCPSVGVADGKSWPTAYEAGNRWRRSGRRLASRPHSQ